MKRSSDNSLVKKGRNKFPKVEPKSSNLNDVPETLTLFIKQLSSVNLTKLNTPQQIITLFDSELLKESDLKAAIKNVAHLKHIFDSAGLPPLVRYNFCTYIFSVLPFNKTKYRRFSDMPCDNDFLQIIKTVKDFKALAHAIGTSKVRAFNFQFLGRLLMHSERLRTLISGKKDAVFTLDFIETYIGEIDIDSVDEDDINEVEDNQKIEHKALVVETPKKTSPPKASIPEQPASSSYPNFFRPLADPQAESSDFLSAFDQFYIEEYPRLQASPEINVPPPFEYKLPQEEDEMSETQKNEIVNSFLR